MAFNSIFKDNLFQGKVVIITGGGTGIGRCIAHELSALGAAVALGSRTPAKPAVVQREIESDGGSAFAGECNIRDRESISRFVEGVMHRFGRIDGLVNNGGGQFMSPAEMISPKGWHAVIETNLTGTWNMTQAVMQASMRENGGAIVNITMDNNRGYPGMAHSAAARAGVENLTKTLAIEWAQFGIRVNCVAPGFIQSSGLQNYPQEIQAEFPKFAETVPAKRFGSESEVSAMVAFLLSPAATYISGANYLVDGGRSLWASPYPIEDDVRWPTPFDGFASDSEAT